MPIHEMSSVRNTSAKTVKMSDMVDMNVLALDGWKERTCNASSGNEEKLSLQLVSRFRRNVNSRTRWYKQY